MASTCIKLYCGQYLNKLELATPSKSTIFHLETASDFEAIEHQTGGERSEISLVTISDTIVEYNETFVLRFEHSSADFESRIMSEGEFIRNIATVNIIDNDGKVYQIHDFVSLPSVFSCYGRSREINL